MSAALGALQERRRWCSRVTAYHAFSPNAVDENRLCHVLERLGADLLHLEGVSETLYIFATFLFTHNAAIGILAFALGFALGVPVILLMFYNGLSIGAFAALYESRGLSSEFWAWLSIHGTTELMAVVICGGAGLLLGSSLAFPGRHSRLENLKRNGRFAGEIAIGAVALFFVAGLLEGLGRQLILDSTQRYLVAATALIWWTLYFIAAGRNQFNGNDN